MAFRKFLLRVEALRRQNFAASVIASQCINLVVCSPAFPGKPFSIGDPAACWAQASFACWKKGAGHHQLIGVRKASSVQCKFSFHDTGAKDLVNQWRPPRIALKELLAQSHAVPDNEVGACVSRLAQLVRAVNQPATSSQADLADHATTPLTHASPGEGQQKDGKAGAPSSDSHPPSPSPMHPSDHKRSESHKGMKKKKKSNNEKSPHLQNPSEEEPSETPPPLNAKAIVVFSSKSKLEQSRTRSPVPFRSCKEGCPKSSIARDITLQGATAQ
eukprot:jgi/Bigna1/83300/fgenesh1_pg.105_\